MQTKLNYDFTENMNLKSRLLITALLLTIFTSIKAECTEKTYDRDTTLISYLKEFNIHTTTKNELTLLTSGHDKFVDLFKELEKARHHIHLEYFNFRNDSIANTLFEILERKAQEGVEIRAMYDAFGNSSNNQPLKNKHIKSLHEKGIEIVEFDPIKFPWINHVWARDHRKIAIIDGVIGYTGGMNIADYYITGLPKIGEWRDMHIKIKGEAVQDLQKIFLQMWNECTKQDIDGEAYFPYVKDSTFSADQNNEVAIVDRRPKKTPKTMRKVYAKAIESAQEKVQIINPYFTPTRTIRKAITNAVKKGVKVEIMIPGKSDIKFSPDAAMYIANQLRKKGADIYIFNGGFHHSKIMMVDSTYCTVGSTNLNSRSLHYDYEVNAFVFDKETTSELMDIFKEDQENSTLLTAEMYKKRSVWKKFVGWFAHLLTPFL